MSDTALLTGVIELVKREVKGQATSDEIRWLKQPENLQRWIGALEIAIEDLLLQFDDWEDRLARAREEKREGILETQDYLTLLKVYEDWRKKASRYRLGLEQKLLEVSLKHDQREPIVDVLINAIESHKKELSRERTVAPTDLRLWSLIEKLDNKEID
jgi:hypothetical protein